MRALILTTTMAPYRVALFEELGRHCQLTVCFEQQHEASREKAWFAGAAGRFRSVCLKHWDKSPRRVKWEVLRHLKRDRTDLAIAYEYSTATGILFTLACRLQGIPYIINCDGALPAEPSFKDRLKGFLVRGAAACFANGASARRYFQRLGARDEDIHPHHFTSLHARDIPAAPPTRAERAAGRAGLGLSGYSRVVVTAGRFIPSKRIEDLIAAWAAMPPDWLLAIAGSGDLEPEYRSLMARLSLENVRLTGHLAPPELRTWYLAADLFVLPTASDVWGLVVNEAMAAGLPVITTDRCVAGLELVVEGENGHILPVGEVGLLAERIKAVLADEGALARLSANALRTIQGHTYEACAASHLEVMARVVGAGARSAPQGRP